jgi:ATP-dependent helicase HrpB
MPPFDRPEILEAELSSLVLDCAAWGAVPAALAFLDPPPPQGALAAAGGLLVELGALDAEGRITATGRRMAALGAHPRLAAMMLAATNPAEASLAADIAALLEERDPLRGPEAPADIGSRLAAIAHGDPVADRGALARIRRVAAQYRRRLRTDADPDGDAGRLLAAGFPDRIAQRRGEPGSFRLSGGGGARLPRADPLANASLLAVAALEMKQAARIRMAARLDPEALPASRITEQVEVSFDSASGAVLARRRRRFGALVLSDRTEPADPVEVAGALARAVAADMLRPLPWTDPARQLQARVALMRRLEPAEAWPDLSDEALIAEIESWLAPHLAGLSRLGDVGRLELVGILRGLIPWNLVGRLSEALPAHLDLPKGRVAVDYTQTVPVASAKAQAFYGLTATPTLAGGRVPLQLALLSPAGRPVAITADLASFWGSGWADVRRDMRGRYPKHDWPEHPTGDRNKT